MRLVGAMLLFSSCASEPAPKVVETDLAIPPPPRAEAKATEVPPVMVEPARTTPRPAPHSAAPNPNADAERLFEEGRQAMAEGRFPKACELFERSMALDPGLGTMLNLGACREQLGDMMEACKWYRTAEMRAVQLAQSDRARFAGAKATALQCP